MGLRPADFERMTMSEFLYAWLGWSSRETARLKQAWERERWSVWVLTSIQLERKDRRPMTQMFPLPWEEQTAQPQRTLSAEERKERINEMIRCIRR